MADLQESIPNPFTISRICCANNEYIKIFNKCVGLTYNNNTPTNIVDRFYFGNKTQHPSLIFKWLNCSAPCLYFYTGFEECNSNDRDNKILYCATKTNFDERLTYADAWSFISTVNRQMLNMDGGTYYDDYHGFSITEEGIVILSKTTYDY
jgi:hypothetical protein